MKQFSKKQTERLVKNYTKKQMSLEEVLEKVFKGETKLGPSASSIESVEEFKRLFVAIVRSGEVELFRANNTFILLYSKTSEEETAIFDLFSPETNEKLAMIDFYLAVSKLKLLGYEEAITYTQGEKNKQFATKMLSDIAVIEDSDDPTRGEYMVSVDLTELGAQ